MFSGYYICKIMRWFLDALQYKQMWSFHRCSVVTVSARSWLQDSLGSFLYSCLIQLANYTLHNHCLFSCNQGNHSVVKTTNLFLQWYEHCFVINWRLWMFFGIVNTVLRSINICECFLKLWKLFRVCDHSTFVNVF